MSRGLKNVFMLVILVTASIGIIFAYREAAMSARVQFDINNVIQEKFPEENFNSSFSKEEMKPEDVEKFRKENIIIDKEYVAIFAICSIVISIILTYSIMSSFNKRNFRETFKNVDKVTIFILSVIILSCLGVYAAMYFSTDVERKTEEHDFMDIKDVITRKEDVTEGVVVKNKNINLSSYDSNITIDEKGEYFLKGELNNSLIIDAKDEVVLNLEGVKIKNDKTASIINKSENELKINLVADTVNELEDGGSSEYDACIYSLGDLVIDGMGELKIYGKQRDGEGIATEAKNITINSGIIYIESVDDGINAGGNGGLISINGEQIYIDASGDGIDSNKDLIINEGTLYVMGSSVSMDAAIDTDEGFTMNGGTLVAIGTDMLETPLKESKQNTICFTFANKIAEGTLVSLVNEKGNAVISFKAKKAFKTLILSSKSLKSGDYNLYMGGKISGKDNLSIYLNGKYEKGEKVKIGEKDLFIISESITNYK